MIISNFEFPHVHGSRRLEWVWQLEIRTVIRTHESIMDFDQVVLILARKKPWMTAVAIANLMETVALTTDICSKLVLTEQDASELKRLANQFSMQLKAIQQALHAQLNFGDDIPMQNNSFAEREELEVWAKYWKPWKTSFSFFT